MDQSLGLFLNLEQTQKFNVEFGSENGEAENISGNTQLHVLSLSLFLSLSLLRNASSFLLNVCVCVSLYMAFWLLLFMTLLASILRKTEQLRGKPGHYHKDTNS